MAAQQDIEGSGALKPQVYRDERPAEHFARFHARTRAKPPNWMYEAVRLVLTPYLLIFFRTRAIDVLLRGHRSVLPVLPGFVTGPAAGAVQRARPAREQALALGL